MNHKLEVCKRCECELGKGFHSLFQVVQRFKAILCHSMLGFFYWAVIHFCLILCSKIQEALLLVGIFEIKLSIWVRILDPSPGRGEAMAPHSSPPAWKIPWTEKPGGLQSMRLLRVGHDWVTSLSYFTFMHWKRKWQPTPVFLPGESQGQGSLVGCHLWGRTESDRTEAT